MHIPEDLSPADGWRYYFSHHRTRDGYKKVIVSTPNADWCPSVWWSPDSGVLLRADGTFGWNDPISWPHVQHPDMPHLSCIPLSDAGSHPLIQSFRHGLFKDQVTFTDIWDDGFRVATLSEDFVRSLRFEVDRFVKDAQGFLSAQQEAHPRLEYLLRSLGTATAKISTLQETLPRLRLTFGLTSRLYLEAFGYTYYHTKHQQALRFAGKPTVNPHLVGVLVHDVGACAKYHRLGIPVWLLRELCDIWETKHKFVKATDPISYASRSLWPPDRFRDDGDVMEEPALLQGGSDIEKLLNAIDSWVASRLKDGFR